MCKRPEAHVNNYRHQYLHQPLHEAEQEDEQNDPTNSSMLPSVLTETSQQIQMTVVQHTCKATDKHTLITPHFSHCCLGITKDIQPFAAASEISKVSLEPFQESTPN